VFKFLKKLNKSSIGISGCFFSLPLFKILQYYFGSDGFFRFFNSSLIFFQNKRKNLNRKPKGDNPGLITNVNLPEKTIGNLKENLKKKER
jgi:hypothetical protein